MANKIMHPTRGGGSSIFDASEEACGPFGFFYKDRVATPKGHAAVIGVRERNLWFHIDGDDDASHWQGHVKSDFEKKGFRLLESANPVRKKDVVVAKEALDQADDGKKEVFQSTDGSVPDQQDLDSEDGATEEMVSAEDEFKSFGKKDVPILESEEDRKQRIEAERQQKLAMIHVEDNIKVIVRICMDDADDAVRLAALRKFDPVLHSSHILKCLKRGNEAVQLAALDMIDPKINSLLLSKLGRRADHESVRLAAINRLDPIKDKYALEKIFRKSSGDVQVAAQNRLESARVESIR